MKTRFKIKNLGLGILTVLFMLISVNGFSQACATNQVTVSIQNVTNPTPTTVEYDIYVKNTGPTTLKLAAYGGCVRYPAGGFASTAILSVLTQPSATGNFPGFPNLTPNHTLASQQLRWTNTPPLAEGGAVSLPAGVDMFFARFRLTNAVAWAQSTAGNLFLSTGGSGISVNTTNVFCNGNATSTDPLTIANGKLVLAAPVNFTINAPTETCFNSGVASNLTEVTCFGGNNGSATITMDPVPAPSLNATYSVDGGVSTPVTLTAGGAFNVSGLTVGPHTITVTGSGGCTTPVNVPVTISGPTSQPTNTTTQTACDTFTWSVTGQTYTATGTYNGTSVNGNGCTVNEVLNLTINNSTSSSETVTACDTYTWAANGTTYTASGTYTFSGTNAAGCPDSQTLVLTINNSTSSSMSATACDTYTWAANGTTYTTSGTYTNVTTNAAGCPDTATLVLTINNSTSSTLNVTSSTPYTWAANGTTYSVSGTYTHVTTNAAGCPDTATLNLVIATGPTTSISPTLCGITLTAISTQVTASLVPGAQAYRFKVTNTVTNQVQTIDRILRFFYLTQLGNYAFNTPYSIEVAVMIGGVWQAYGTPCVVSTPSATTQVQASQCGGTLTTMGESILADNVPYAAGYRFKITNSITSAVSTVDRSTRLLVLTGVPGFTPEFNTTYSIEVAVKNTDNSYLAYGTACNVTTPAFPTSQLQASQCDVTISNMNTTVYADSYSGASTYRFKFTNGSFVYVLDRSTRSFVLSSVPGLTAGNTYSVQVSLEINGVFGPYGKICTITLPGVGKTATSVEFQAVAYPNPYAENFMLDVKTASDELIEVRVYDMLGKLIEDRKVDVASIANLEVGSRYPSGVYNVIVSQGDSIKTLRVIKR